MGWIHLVHHTVQWRALVNTVMNHRARNKTWKLLTERLLAYPEEQCSMKLVMDDSELFKTSPW